MLLNNGLRRIHLSDFSGKNMNIKPDTHHTCWLMKAKFADNICEHGYNFLKIVMLVSHLKYLQHKKVEPCKNECSSLVAILKKHNLALQDSFLKIIHGRILSITMKNQQ